MTNAVCAFIYDYPEALRTAFDSGCKHLFEMPPNQSAIHYTKLSSNSPLCVSITSRSAFRHLIAKEICRELASRLRSLDAEALTAVQTTLHEAITNAIMHGNLAIHSNYTTAIEMEEFYSVVKNRLRDDSFGNRYVHIEVN